MLTKHIYCVGRFGLVVALATACGDSKQPSSTNEGAGGSGTASASAGGSQGGGGDAGEAGARGDGGTGLAGTGGGTAAGGTRTTSEAGAAGQGGSVTLDPPAGEAGYLDLDPYTFDGGPELAGLTTSSARLFYSFLEADTDARERPVFVFTGGITDLSAGSIMAGPASTGLFSVFGVSRVSLRDDDLTNGVAPNPQSWTDMGNLLFIDGRQSGFSYSRLSDPLNDGARGAEFASNNFNNFVDAADFVRGLLRFFAMHPDLADNPVVIVGQGYASIRTSLMLSYLLYPERLRADAAWSFVDEDLADEIAAHYASIFPEAGSVTRAQAASQFGWQIQIQPKVGGDQEGLTDDLWCQAITGFESAERCPPPGRDPLHIGKDDGWALLLRQASREALVDPTAFESTFLVHPADVAGLPAEARSGAYRLSSMLAVEGSFPKASSSWSDALGSLPDHDRYYIGDVEQLIAGNSNFTEGNDLACQVFIETVQHVATFVTNALLDGRVRTEVLAASLEDCASWTAEPLIDAVTSDLEPRDGVARPGWLTLEYNNTAELGANTRTLRFPVYPQAGHLVSVSAPAELKADVREFLESSGLALAD